MSSGLFLHQVSRASSKTSKTLLQASLTTKSLSTLSCIGNSREISQLEKKEQQVLTRSPLPNKILSQSKPSWRKITRLTPLHLLETELTKAKQAWPSSSETTAMTTVLFFKQAQRCTSLIKTSMAIQFN
jgi:hypothetical protein